MKIKIGRRALNTLPLVSGTTIFYDTDLTGFGLKASAAGALSYIVEYRPGAGGRVGMPAYARDDARSGPQRGDANSPNPEPSTTAIVGMSGDFLRMNSAAAAT